MPLDKNIIRRLHEKRGMPEDSTPPKLDTAPQPRQPRFTRSEVACMISDAVATERERNDQILIRVIARLQDEAAVQARIPAARTLLDEVIEEKIVSRGAPAPREPARH